MKKIKESEIRSIYGGYKCGCGATWSDDFWGWCAIVAHLTLTAVPCSGYGGKITYHYWV